MSKVLIVTKIGKNYGALLQAYALKKVLENRKHEVSVLNYELASTMETYRVIPKVNGARSIIHIIQSIPRVIKTRISVKRFLRFRNDYLSLSVPYKNYEELVKKPPAAEVYITGSDQVWNPKINFDKAYYLLFGGSDVVRASYAASIGINTIPDSIREEFVQRLSNVQYKSVREIEGKHLLHSLGIEAEVNLDPTLLLSRKDYEAICRADVCGEPYVLLYLLIMPDDVKQYIINIRKLYPHCKIISIPGSTYSKKIGDIERGDIGPEEFLGLIKNAEAVFTSSFHGTVFSILYEKQFASYLPPKTGGRIRNLLSEFRLTDRIIETPEDIKTMVKPIDFMDAQKIRKQEIERANEYLNTIFLS